MEELRVKPAKSVPTIIRVPGDKSISHRAAIFASLANGACEISGFLPSDDCMATVGAMRALGVEIEALPANEDEADATEDGQPDDPERPTRLRVHGRSMKLSEPVGEIDCGNSGTSMRLLAGLLAAQPFKSTLTGDHSLRSRPMERVIEPLKRMGADIKALGKGGCAPLSIVGGDLKHLRYELPVASAQVKSCVLIAGLFADGKTTVIEPETTRDHTERLLGYHLVNLVKQGHEISTYGGQVPESRDIRVPGDISSAAFWLVAAAGHPGCELTIEGVGLNNTRTGILDVLVRMGAAVQDVVTNADEGGEPQGRIIVRGGELKGISIDGDIIPNIIDELPIIAVAGALAGGQTTIRDAAELRVKEADRISSVANNLRAFGVEVEEFFDGMTITGGAPLKGARVSSFGDHRIAMAFAVAGLFAEGETIIEDTACIATSYPGFEEELGRFMDTARSR